LDRAQRNAGVSGQEADETVPAGHHQLPNRRVQIMSANTLTLDVEVPGQDKLMIAGEWVAPATGTSAEVISPSTEDVIATVADPSTEDADRAVAAARAAFDDGPWPRMSMQERVDACTRLCDELERRLPAMNRAWAHESGAPIAHGEMINDGAGVMVWRQTLDIALTLDFEEQREDAVILRDPVGVVLAILTYNGPVVLMGMKVIPAMLAGCPVIVKHAPESALTARLIADAAVDAELPSGVLSVLPAGTEVTQHLVGHPGVDMVTLTGGTAIGVDVVKRTADRLARTLLELGGKSPAILLEDVDLDAAMETLVPGASGFMGQVCLSLSRVLAPRERYQEVVDALASRYAALRIGDPFDPDTERGPLAVKRARDRTERYVEGAIADGAEVAAGGKRPAGLDRGYYYEPTVLAGVTNEMTVARDEIFGPVTVVIPYEDADEAVRIANDSRYGLASSIYGADTDLAMAIARRIQTGAVAINVAGISLGQPFGGVKQSGWGKECGAEGVLEFTSVKQVITGGSYLD
jgi:aldehyde dehydrogenase (NAD+)